MFSSDDIFSFVEIAIHISNYTGVLSQGTPKLPKYSPHTEYPIARLHQLKSIAMAGLGTCDWFEQQGLRTGTVCNNKVSQNEWYSKVSLRTT